MKRNLTFVLAFLMLIAPLLALAQGQIINPFHFGTADPTAATIVIDGNGITLGSPFGNAYSGGGYPSKMETYLNTMSGASYTYVNLSLGGKTTQTMSTSSGTIDPYRTSSHDVYIPFDCGSNDITEQSKTATQALGYLQTLVTNEHSTGFKVIINTLPARAEESNPTVAGYMASINASILSGAVVGADAIIDLRGMTQFQDYTDARYYYNDGVHFTDEGYRLLAQKFGEKILELNGAPAALSTISGTVTNYLGTPVSGARVTLKPAGVNGFVLDATSDGSGNFTLPQTGNHDSYVFASKLGYGFPWTHYATLTSSQSVTLAALVDQTSAVATLTNIANGTDSGGGVFTRAAGSAWNAAGYASGETFTSDGRADIVINSASTNRIFAVSTGTGHNYTDTSFKGWWLRDDNTLQILESGGPVANVGFPLAIGSRIALRIRTESSTRLLEWILDDMVVRTATLTSDPYYVNWDVNTSGATTEPVNFAQGGDTVPSIVTDGNSIPAGVFNTTPYPTLVENALVALGARYRYYNVSVSGQTTQDATADAATQVDPLSNPNSNKNILVFEEIRNDIHNNNLSGPQEMTNLIAYFNGRTANKRFLYTQPPNYDLTGTQETARVYTNAHIISDAATYNWTPLDVGSDARWQDPTSATWWADAPNGVHPNDAQVQAYTDDYEVPAIIGYNPIVSWTISGNIVDGSSNPISGVLVSSSGGWSTSGSTNGSGNYSYGVPDGFTITSTPTKTNYVFSPISVTHTSLSANQTDNFVATLLVWITGQNLHAGTEDDTAHTFTTTGSDGWGLHGLTSVQTITNGTIATVRFSVPYNSGKDCLIGLSTAADNSTYTDVTEGVYFQSPAAPNEAQPWKSGASTGTDAFTYTAGTAYKIVTYSNAGTWSAKLTQDDGTLIHDFGALGSTTRRVVIIPFNTGLAIDLPTRVGF